MLSMKRSVFLLLAAVSVNSMANNHEAINKNNESDHSTMTVLRKLNKSEAEINATIKVAANVTPASYGVPDGVLFQSPTIKFGYTEPTAIGPSNIEMVFTVANPDEESYYCWNYSLIDDYSQDPVLMPVVESTSLTLPAQYKSVYAMPELISRSGNTESSYQLGKEYFFNDFNVIPKYRQSGTSFTKRNASTNEIVEFSGFTNADLDMGISLGRYATDPISKVSAYMFGTGCDKFPETGISNGINSVLARFDRPASALSFNAVDILLDTIVAPQDVNFYCHVIRIKEELNGIKPVYLDTIAVAKASMKNVYTESYAWLQFTEFYKTDKFTQNEKIADFTMTDAFVIEISGFNKQGVIFGPVTERMVKDSHKVKSFFTTVDNGDRSICHWGDTTPNVFISLRNAAYGYIRPDKSKIDINKDGGEFVVRVSPLFNNVNPIFGDGEKGLPEWLYIEQNENYISPEIWYSDIILYVNPLPQGAPARSYNLKLGNYGGRESVEIIQHSATGVDGIDANTGIKVRFTADKLVVESLCQTTMSVYNVSGKLMGNYVINGDEIFDASSYLSGLYIIKFSEGNVVKLIK